MTDVERLAAKFAGKRLLIFDFDGTLVDSSPIHAKAFDAVFEPYGVKVDYDRIAGLSTAKAIDLIADREGLKLDRAERESLARSKQRLAREAIASGLRPIDGAVDFVRRAASTFDLALCTSASRATVEIALPTVGLAGCFDPVVTADDISSGKPEPDAFLAALHAHGARPEEALVFEDADSGLSAARAAHIDCVRIVPPGQKGGNVDEAHSDWPTLLTALERARR